MSEQKQSVKKLSQTQFVKLIMKALESNKDFPHVNGDHDGEDAKNPSYLRFKRFIMGLLITKARMPVEVLNELGILKKRQNMQWFLKAIRHVSVDLFNNNDSLEQLGDESFQKAFDDFIVFKHPELYHDVGASSILTEALKSFLLNSSMFSRISVSVPTEDGKGKETIFLNEFIHFRKVEYEIEMKTETHAMVVSMDRQIQQYTFFALLAAVEIVIDGLTKNNMGWVYVRNIVYHYLQEEDIPIKKSETMSTTQKMLMIAKSHPDTIKYYMNPELDNEGITVEYVNGTLKIDGKTHTFRSEYLYGDRELGNRMVAKQMLKVLADQYNIRYEDKNTQFRLKETERLARLPEDKMRMFIGFLIKTINREGKFKCTEKELIDAKAIEIINRAFRHPSIENKENYEVYETLGDKTYNKIITMYVARKYPEVLFDKFSSKKLVEAGKKFHSKYEAPAMTDSLGLMNYLMYQTDERYGKDSIIRMNDRMIVSKLKTDTLESFLYLVETLVDRKFGVPCGFHVAYSILENFLNKHAITVDLALLIPISQQVKELYDYLRGILRKDQNAIIVTFEEGLVCDNRFLGNRFSFQNYEEAKRFVEDKCHLVWTEDGVVRN